MVWTESGRDWRWQRLWDGSIGRRRHTSAGTQAVRAWMGFCHEWITSRNVGRGEDESFTRLSLFISSDPQSGLWRKQISQLERSRGESLLFSLRCWDAAKGAAKVVWQAKVYGFLSGLCTSEWIPPMGTRPKLAHPCCLVVKVGL